MNCDNMMMVRGIVYGCCFDVVISALLMKSEAGFTGSD